MRGILLSALVIVLTSACGQAKLEPGLGPKPVAIMNLPTTPTISSARKLGGAVVIYKRSGGLAGISEQWTIFPDGRIVSLDDREFTASAAMVSTLVAKIKALGFFELESASSLPSSCADCFNHQITVDTGGKPTSITVEGSVADPQDPKMMVLEAINKFLISVLKD